MPPEIFTTTPIEAYIVAVFMRGQMAAARMINGTATFRAVLFGVLAGAIVLSFWRMAAHRHHAGLEIGKIIYRVAMVFLALAFLGYKTNLNFGSDQGTWGSRPGVQRNPQMAAALASGGSETLFWYSVPYRALNQVSKVTVGAITGSFGNPALAQDPMFVQKMLARMSLMSFSPSTAAQFEALNRDCSDTVAAQALKPGDSIAHLFDVAKPGCATMLANFQSALDFEGNAMLNRYPPGVLQSLRRVVPGGNTTALKNAMIANAVENFTADRAGFANARFLDNNRNQNRATFSDVGDSMIEVATRDGGGLMGAAGGVAMTYADMIAGIWGGNAHDAAVKAEMANKFNLVGTLLPAARGFLHGLLGLLFVFAAYSVGFGTWAFMRAWLMALATLALYQPVAVLGYSVMTQLEAQNTVAQALADLERDPLILGGARILSREMVHMQTVYLCFEFGAFLTFALGALAMFKPLGHLSNSVGTALGGIAAAGVGKALSGGGGGGENIEVNVNGERQGGRGQFGTSSQAAPRGDPTRGGPDGLITPGSPPPATWDDRAA